MFRPNMRATWLKKSQKRTVTGKETFLPGRALPCAIVSLNGASEPTSVRADSSASRGAAEQMVATSKILVPALYPVAVGDVVRFDGIGGLAIEISSVEPRRDVGGRVDHIELRGRMRSED